MQAAPTNPTTQITSAHLIDDLIPHILEANDHQWWPRDLHRFALISTGWVGPIRRRLYSCPIIRTFGACTLLAKTLRENSYICALVQGIDLQPTNGMGRAGSRTAQELGSLRFLLNLGGLRSVTLGAELSVQAERYLHMMSNTKNITSLYINGLVQDSSSHGASLFHHPSLEWDEVVAYKFPQLQTLRISNVSLSIIPPSLPYALNVTNLILEDVEIVDGFLPHLFHESWDSLRKLKVVMKASTSFDEQLRWMIECCANLQVLHYELRGFVPHHNLFDEDMPSLRSLLTLRLGDVNVNPQCLLSIGQTCLGLAELTVFGRSVQVTPEDWINFLHSGALPALKTLRTVTGTNEPPFNVWDTLRTQSIVDACQARHIAFVSS
ncbi:hypothetical protein NLI96_g10283 [Meripilus lineatus]|uniref:F-box domain-containing protein n=1 Tax=Meripilus lineatus TaxID=2056292 RepID=A0AAD5UVP2_9APHY|nr:hypothetical protein NLI96_g10283 [Physisporinus lineatus]